jgi:macrolide transport system ATP-binding/permease protein
MQMLQDARYAARMLIKTPWVTLAVLLSLGLGIGANVTIFSWVRAIMLEPFSGVPDQSRLVFVTGRRHGGIVTGLSHPDFVDLREAADAFDGLVGIGGGPGAQVSLGGERDSERAEQITLGLVSGNCFDVLRVQPILGRGFRPEEDGAPLAHPVVVISHALWQRRFDGRQDVVGRTIRLDTRTFTVVGVAPADFAGTFPLVVQDAWTPLAMREWAGFGPSAALTNRGTRWVQAIGRLKDGVSVAQANANVSAIMARLEQAYPDTNRTRTAVAEPAWRTAYGAPGLFRPVLLVLVAVAVIVLLLACANIGNMLLARALERRREMAIRISIGASRWRLLRQLLTESLMLASLGGVAGLLCVWWGGQMLVSFFPPTGLQVQLNTSIDGRMLAATAVVSLLTALLIGLAPALQSTRSDVVSTLKDESNTAGGGRRARARSALVVIQVALTLLLLVPAGLFVRSLRQAQATWPGFNPDGVLLAYYNASQNGYTQETGLQLHLRVLERVGALPGVRAVSLTSFMPLAPGGRPVLTTRIDGYVPSQNEDMNIGYNIVGPEYFETMEVPLRDGRTFTSADRADSRMVAIVNETMAARYWPGRSAIGGIIRTSAGTYEVVGTVATGKYRELSEEPLSYFYLPLLQTYRPGVSVLLRTHGDPSALAPGLTSEFQRLDANLPLTGIMTMKTFMDWPTLSQRIAGTLLGAFGVLAMSLAAIGLYGVMAFVVSQRTREVGIRMALGARPGDIWRMVLRYGAMLSLTGIAIGLSGALLLMPQMSMLLIGVGPRDILTFAAAAGALALAAVGASLIPAHRASRVDPVIALRHL